jgi:hypothetical protein
MVGRTFRFAHTDGGISMNPAQLADRHGLDRGARAGAAGDDRHVPKSFPRGIGKRAVSKSDACRTKGAPLRKATSFLLRFIGVPERTESRDWWTYFGSFGDDVFGDEDTADA